MHRPRLRVVICCLAVAFATFLLPSKASADFNLSLSSPGSGISGDTGPYGEISVSLIDSNHATITLTADNNGGNFYRFGDGNSIALNTNGAVSIVGGGSGPTLGGITSSGPNDPSGGSFTLDGGNVSGFGVFNFGLKNEDGAAHALTLISFELEKTSGTWSSDSDVLTANGSGYLAAGHVFVYLSNSGTNAGDTGFAGNGSVNTVPAPAGLLLLASCAPFAFAGRFIRRKLIAAA
jgi:hypothetical protein